MSIETELSKLRYKTNILEKNPSFSGNASVGGNLNIQGELTASSGINTAYITASSALQIDGNLNIQGQLTASNGLSVTYISASSTLQVGGNSTISGNLNIQGQLTASTGINTNNIIASSLTSSAGIYSLQNISVASGKGIDFSLNPSTAGVTSEVLDDYEEGTWTPALVGFTTTGTVTTTGYYVKIGSVVFIIVRIAATTIASTSGTSRITGSPFSSIGFSTAMGIVRNDSTTPTSYGIALYNFADDDIYTPTFSGIPSVVISGFFLAA
jgi:cytoskeletal protein CcmA (bactofilin family)